MSLWPCRSADPKSLAAVYAQRRFLAEPEAEGPPTVQTMTGRGRSAAAAAVTAVAVTEEEEQHWETDSEDEAGSEDSGKTHSGSETDDEPHGHVIQMER